MYFISVLTYLIFGATAVSLAYIAQRNNNKIIATLSLLVCVLFWGLRKDIGFDYEGYVDIFTDIRYGANSYVEIGYYWLNLCFGNYAHGYLAVFFIMSALTYGFLYAALWRYRVLWQGLVFSLAFQFQFMAANQIRQALAIAIFLFVLKYIEEKKYIKFVISIISISILVHASAIVLLLVIPVSKIKPTRQITIPILIIVYAVFLMGKLSGIGNSLFYILPIPEQYSLYLSSERVNPEYVGFSIVQLFNVIIGFYIMWNQKYVPSTFVAIYFWGLLMYITFIEYHLFLRLSFYFLYINILIVSLFCKNSSKYAQIIVAICIVFYILVCCQSSNMHGVIPYKSLI